MRVVRHLQTGNTYAMKTLHLNRIKSKASLADLRNEVRFVYHMYIYNHHLNFIDPPSNTFPTTQTTSLSLTHARCKL